jgi:large subunit ribosomal protein L10
MAVTRKVKEQAFADLKESFAGAKSIVFADYRGTTVKKIEELRKNMRAEGVSTKVAKLTLIRKALQEQGIDVSTFDFKAPVAVMISKDDEVTPAKILNDFTKENKNVQILMGVMEGLVLSAQQVTALAQLPSKQQLRGQLVGTIAAPMTGFVNVLAGNLRGLVYALNAIAEAKS